jgi:hypothetical protein
MSLCSDSVIFFILWVIFEILSAIFCDFIMPHYSDATIFVILLVILEILLVIFMILSDIIDTLRMNFFEWHSHFCDSGLSHFCYSDSTIFWFFHAALQWLSHFVIYQSFLRFYQLFFSNFVSHSQDFAQSFLESFISSSTCSQILAALSSRYIDDTC